MLEDHLQTRDFLAADRYTIADISVFAYSHLAGEAGIDLHPYPLVRSWLDRVTDQPNFVNDLAPYPPNASQQIGLSIYG